jgi:flavin reductase (DIM6/NTAB) family NADH-FMN oxidoreductase RutF
MKIEIGRERPEFFQESWPGEFDHFSHFEGGAAVPGVLSLITTLKGNGRNNACFFAGASFMGDKDNYYAVLPGMGGGHTYANIMREKEFCVNFISSEYYAACEKTIANNEEGDDEITAGGFTAEPAKMIKAPWIGESFVSFECKLVTAYDIAGNGKYIICIGEVLLARVGENYHLPDHICGNSGFMFSINAAANPLTGERMPFAAAYLTQFKI